MFQYTAVKRCIKKEINWYVGWDPNADIRTCLVTVGK
jgi:hypothetical protein